jgi:hypothetical protein
MSYDTDTLTNANRNREASRKFFQQLEQNQQQGRPFVFSQINLVPTSPTTTMLHRSPSGAQRKIRQRREEISQQHKQTSSSSLQQQQQRSFVSSETMTTTSSNETFIDLEYRTLVDSSAYRSILDDNNIICDIGKSSEDFPTNRVAINTFAKPEPPRRTLGAIDDSNISKNTDKYTYPPHDNLNGQIFPGKPTVEVHPMPAPRNSFNSLSKNIIPPPIPKKPERLKKMSTSSNTGKYSDDIMSISVSPNENELPNDSHIRQDAETSSDTSLFDKIVPKCYSVPCSSIEALDKLHTSPLVRSIEEKFDDVRASVIESDSTELTELERRLISTINKLTKKVNERTSDLDSIKNEKESAITTIQSLLGSHSTFPKIEKEIRMRAHLIQLEGVARVRLQQISSLGKEQASALLSRSSYWQDKIKDIRYLAVFVSQRISEIEDEIYNYLDQEDFTTYKKCMDLLIELEAENTETAEKLATVQKQIEQLENISSFQNSGKIKHEN